jgi:hypothetical protein
VVVRASVDGNGQAQRLDVVSGERKRQPAALAAARRWHFQPCASDAGCEHSLMITEYGDAFSVQVIE